MRTSAPPLMAIFRSRLQGDLLARVLLGSDAPSVSGIARDLDAPVPTVHREVVRLVDAGLLITAAIGRNRSVAANESNPAVAPLRELVMIAFGPTQVVREEFGGIDGVESVAIFGSWAARYRGEEGPPPHDVDVLVVGAPDRMDVYDAADRAARRLHREVNPTVVSPANWRDADQPFVRQLHERPLVTVTDAA